MPGMHITDLKANTGAFARAYLFNVYFDVAPVPIIGGENKTAYLVRSTSLPESTIGQIEVPWQGQTYKFGSTHEYSEWECTFNVDQSAELIENMHSWQRKIHNPANNEQGVPDDYFGTVILEQLDNIGSPIYKYTLRQVWPSSVGAIDVAHDSKEVSQVSVTFTYNFHLTEKI